MKTNPKSTFPLIPAFARSPLTKYVPTSSNTSQQLVSLQIDVSGSMSGSSITQVQRSASDFASQCSEDILTRERLQVQLVTFGGSIQIQPFVPISRFTPPRLNASGDTPLAEALLAAINETERYKAFLEQAAELEVPRPYYFLFSDGAPTSPQDLLDEVAATIARKEQTRCGAFFGFGVDCTAVERLQPLFIRTVHLLPDRNFAAFFDIVSVSVRSVSSRSVSNPDDLEEIIRISLRYPRKGDRNA
jgi:uncharacterized protein YegL